MNKQDICDTERRVLVVNAMVDGGLADSFDGAIRRPLEKVGVDFELRRLLDCRGLEQGSPFSHLIISGSEASVMEERPEDELLLKIVMDFVDREKRVLGICYGHQFLAANLYRKDCCRKSSTPEFGWAEIQARDNPLFGDAGNPYCMVSHYDEVFDLDGRFDVIASTEHCGVHGFQYGNLPVWGLQFHPEYNDAEATEIFTLIKDKDPGAADRFLHHHREPSRRDFLRNESIISGFSRI